MTNLDDELRSATAGLKGLAAGPAYRAAFLENGLLSETLWPAASRYIVAQNRQGLLERLPLLAELGYAIGVEVVGEEAADAMEVEQVVLEYEALIRESAAGRRAPIQLGFDLSSVGSFVSQEVAFRNTSRLLSAAATHGINVIISMENSGLVDGILDIVTQLAASTTTSGSPCRRTCTAPPRTSRRWQASVSGYGWSRVS